VSIPESSLHQTTLCALPLELRWGAGQPLPVRSVRVAAGTRRRSIGLESRWQKTGPSDQPFDFSAHVRRLCADMVTHCEDLAHVDVSRLLFGMTQARSGRHFGLQARVTPFRFHKGALVRHRHGVGYRVQRYFVDGVEMLYLVTFCLPRFLDQTFEDKFITLFHELYHISPAFDGDLRRHAGRYYLHSQSEKAYDDHMTHLARAYLSNGADRNLHDFLRLDFAQLQYRHGSVVSVVVPRPKLIPIVVGPPLSLTRKRGNLLAADQPDVPARAGMSEKREP